MSAPAVADVAVAGGELTLTALTQGDAEVTVTARDAGGLSAEQSFTATVPNRAPEATRAIPAAEVHVGDRHSVDLSAHFEDPDGDSLSYSAEVSAPAVAGVAVSGGELTLTALAQGDAEVTVTARDAGSFSAQQSFAVTVPNRAPEATRAIPAAEVHVGDRLSVDLSAHFADPDGDSLSYSAEVSAPAVADVAVAGGELTLTALAQGDAEVTVTARDAGGLSARQTFDAAVRLEAGYLHVAFRHDEADMAGLAVLLEGPVVDSIRAAPGLTAYSTVTGEEIRLVLLGPIPPAGTLFTFWTEDVTRVGEFAVRAIEAVAKSYEPRSVDGSSIAVRR